MSGFCVCFDLSLLRSYPFPLFLSDIPSRRFWLVCRLLTCPRSYLPCNDLSLTSPHLYTCSSVYIPSRCPYFLSIPTLQSYFAHNVQVMFPFSPLTYLPAAASPQLHDFIPLPVFSQYLRSLRPCPRVPTSLNSLLRSEIKLSKSPYPQFFDLSPFPFYLSSLVFSRI